MWLPNGQDSCLIADRANLIFRSCCHVSPSSYSAIGALFSSACDDDSDKPIFDESYAPLSGILGDSADLLPDGPFRESARKDFRKITIVSIDLEGNTIKTEIDAGPITDLSGDFVEILMSVEGGGYLRYPLGTDTAIQSNDQLAVSDCVAVVSENDVRTTAIVEIEPSRLRSCE